MGEQYPIYFSEEMDVKFPLNPATPGYQTQGGGYGMDRVSNISTDSQPSLSDFSPIPPSPTHDMSSYPVYGGNPLPSQPYDSSYASFPQPESVRHTPTSLNWGLQGVDFVKLYKFIVPKAKLPYLELVEKWTETYQTPKTVYLDEPRSNEKNRFPCRYPGCTSKQTVFSRPADLDRHYRNVHASNKDSFPCDYPKCPRSVDPFTRKDHLRDHIRDFHKEDIGAAKGEKSSRRADKEKWERAQRAWLSERNISPKYWRCAKCLVKNSIIHQGYECSSCKMPCEEDRIRNRQNRAPGLQTAEVPSEIPMVDTSQYPIPYCGACHDSTYLDNGHGAYETCHVCQPVQPQGHYSYGTSYENIIYN